MWCHKTKCYSEHKLTSSRSGRTTELDRSLSGLDEKFYLKKAVCVDSYN